MIRLQNSLAAALLLSVTTSLVAQLPVQFRGTIEKLAKSERCSPKATHRIKCTNTLLFGAKGVDLKSREGQTVLIKGTLRIAPCLTIEASSVESTRFTYRISSNGSGKFKLGETVSFRTRGPFLSLMPFVLAGGTTFVPLSTYGALQLDPLSSVLFETNLAIFGTKTIRIKIPNDKSLVGARIFGQGAYIRALPSVAGEFLNVDCFQIRAR